MTPPSSPLICAPQDKAWIEAENSVAQLEYLTKLVERRKVREVRESHVQELHRIAVDHIYPCGGQYRDPRFQLKILGSRHSPPEPAFIPGHVRDLADACNRRDKVGTHRAAHALWRLNWIHPFAGGNGRTARALAYLVLCIDFGRMLPGVPTIPALLEKRRDEYLDALMSVDALDRAGALTRSIR